MEEKKFSIFNPNKYVAFIIYLLLFLILGSLFILLSAYIVSSANNLNASTLISYLTKSGEDIPADYNDAKILVNSIGNLIIYSLGMFFICFYLRDEIKNDFLNILKDKKFFLIYIPIVGVLFCALAFGIDKINLLIPESQNQSTIVEMIKGPLGVPIILSTILIAPFIEELIFRKCIFYFFRTFNPVVAFSVSSISFTLMHMLSTTNVSVGIWFLMCVPYLLDTLLLCFSYYFGKKNVYASWFGHMLNNLLAIILILI
ncbi:MAG: CPBP family intramembrane metalloprotease [Acholeplasmatales bacterium]|nr:CPBP family intramembrane metalloprotease [Acholeplasmatales bacterium]